MTRKPDVIKKGLEYISIKDVARKLDAWEDGIPYDYVEDAAADALALIQQLEATVSEKEKVVAELSGKIGQLEADNKLMQDAVDQWEFVAASPGAVEDMARENAELLKKVEQLQAERDAAVGRLKQIRDCERCKNYPIPMQNIPCLTCTQSNNSFEWRGVTKEE